MEDVTIAERKNKHINQVIDSESEVRILNLYIFRDLLGMHAEVH